MKRLFAVFAVLALTLSGCAVSPQGLKEPVTFYYLLEEYAYGQDAQVFAPEEREVAGHRDDLKYLLTLYMIGPSKEGHVSPLSRSTRVSSAKQTGSGVFLNISDTSSSLSDAAFTRACACLTLTCLELTDAQEVTVRSGSRSITMSRDTLILADNTPMTTEEAS